MLESAFLCGRIEKKDYYEPKVAPDTEIGIVNMKRAHYLLLTTLSLLLFSCNEPPKTLRPVSSRIDGPLADCFEVVVKDYKIIGNQVNFEFVRIKEGIMEPEITAEFLDENGNVLVTSNVDVNSSKDELKFLLANKVGESSTIAFGIGNSSPTQVRFNGSTTIQVNGVVSVAAMEIGEPEALIENALEEKSDEKETPMQSMESSDSSKDWCKVPITLDELDDYYIVKTCKLETNVAEKGIAHLADAKGTLTLVLKRNKEEMKLKPSDIEFAEVAGSNNVTIYKVFTADIDAIARKLVKLEAGAEETLEIPVRVIDPYNMFNSDEENMKYRQAHYDALIGVKGAMSEIYFDVSLKGEDEDDD